MSTVSNQGPPGNQPEKVENKGQAEVARDKPDDGLSLGNMVSRGDRLQSAQSGQIKDHGGTEEQKLAQLNNELTPHISGKLGRGALSRGLGLSEELGRELSREAGSQPFRDRVLKGETNLPVREFTWSNQRQMDQSANAGLGIPLGLKQFFQLRKSEYQTQPEKMDSQTNVKVENFLSQTPVKEKEKRSPAEEKDLEQSREALKNAVSPEDTLSKALHLARLYQHLRYIDEAKKATELALGIDPENMVARQMFKELERMHPVDISIAALPIAVPNAVTKSALRKRILGLTGGKVAVVGDLLIDELLEGKPERISREAPVLILEHVDTVHIPGGAANTASNVVALGGECMAVGVCGADEYSEKLSNMLDRYRIQHSLVKDITRPTTVKTRILSKSHSLMQQLLRLDRISHNPISSIIEKILIQQIEEAVVGYKAVILSDYRAGVITDGVIKALRQLAEREKTLLIVDAQGDFERFQGATLLTPNQPDTESFLGYRIDSANVEKAGKEMLEKTGAEAVLITRGAEGMALFERGRAYAEMPVFNRSDVFDVTGAGDTVVATMALALVSGASYVEATALGNLAAGIVVRKSGTATTSQREMLETLEQLNIPE
ncbi:MAG: bifunctional hydroxymethylpyrimidine kinase/phosphomethylpyrimidine kinase [Candidatus Obscuribacterales bacterium]|nr:bifunctional hydroxymethylpyrimidine kinase/phosphomethylpyrimidine kinase [Candidatus Obscuribacterales bacterium]